MNSSSKFEEEKRGRRWAEGVPNGVVCWGKVGAGDGGRWSGLIRHSVHDKSWGAHKTRKNFSNLVCPCTSLPFALFLFSMYQPPSFIPPFSCE